MGTEMVVVLDTSCGQPSVPLIGASLCQHSTVQVGIGRSSRSLTWASTVLMVAPATTSVGPGGSKGCYHQDCPSHADSLRCICGGG